MNTSIQRSARAQGSAHVHFDEWLGGLPVFDCGLTVHLTPDMKLAGFDARLIPDASVVIPPDPLTPEEAFARLLESTAPRAGPGGTFDATLGVLAHVTISEWRSGTELAYRIRAYHPTEFPGGLLAYVSAIDGSILDLAPAMVNVDILRRIWSCAGRRCSRVDHPPALPRIDGATFVAQEPDSAATRGGTSFDVMGSSATQATCHR